MHSTGTDRRSKSTAIALILGGAVLSTAVGCVRRASLRPAPEAQEVAGLPRAAISSIDGVRVTAQAGAWPGDPEIERFVTPIKVRIRNDGDAPLLVRYQDFAVVAQDGTRYAALPPYAVEGSIGEPVLSPGYYTVRSPLFSHHGFLVAPYCGPAYPGFDRYEGFFYDDPSYLDHYYQVWLEHPLPTPTMLRHALPEGVIKSGGEVVGFLYFERIDPRTTRVRFRDDLVDAKSGKLFGEASIPFSAKSSKIAAKRSRR